MQVATKKGHFVTVEYLLQSEADVNQRDVRNLVSYSPHSNRIVLTLVHGNMVKQSDGFSALHEAALLGHDDIARLLLKWGADKRLVSGVSWSNRLITCGWRFRDLLTMYLLVR